MVSLSGSKMSLSAVAVLAAISAAPAQAIDLSVSASAEFPSETVALIAATTAFFDAAERAASGKSVTRPPVIGLPEAVSPVGLKTSAPELEELTRHGPVQHLTGYRINWYPVDRFLGAVDFMGTWDNNRNLVCGYITWDMTLPDAPTLDRVDAIYVDVSKLASASAEEVHEVLLEANCAYGAIDVNFAFFEPES